MITEMKKLDLLLYHREQEQFLDSLRDAGVVHITEQYEELSKEAEALRTEIVRVDKAISELKRRDAKSGANVKDGEELLAEFEEGTNDLEQLAQKLVTAEREIKQLEPWGDFDPAQFRKLREHGIYTRFYEVTERLTHLFDDIPHEVVVKHKAGRFLVTVEDKQPEPVPGIEPLFLPEISLSQARLDKKELEEAIAEVESEMDQLAGAADLLKTLKSELEATLVMEQARLSMPGLAENKLLNLEGWVPAEKVNAVEKVLEEFSCWYEFSEPTTDDNIPVKLKNGKTNQLFEPIINIYSLPDYFELDPTAYMAPFFAFFFGLCLGDLGYGILLIAISLFAMMKVPDKLKPFMKLGVILGITTAISGVFLNTFFGHGIFNIPGTDGYFTAGKSLALLSAVKTESGTYFPAMPFAMYIGVIQILFATLLKMRNKLKNNGFVHTLHPAGSFLMTIGVTVLMAQIDFVDLGKLTLGSFAIGPFLMGLPAVVPKIFIFSGMTLLFLFNNPDKKLPVRLGTGLWELYQYVQSLMGDSLSYLRLFALGLAGGLLGAAFNQIAFMFILTEDGSYNYASIGIVGTILVLLFGHLLNFALAALGSFVHPLRLTFVEFYGNLDFKGGAKQYKPLMKTKK